MLVNAVCPERTADEWQVGCAFLHQPPRQGGDPAIGGDHLEQDFGGFDRLVVGDTALGRLQKQLENIQPFRWHGIGDQRFFGERFRCDSRLFRQGVILVDDKHLLVRKNRHEGQTFRQYRIRGDENVDFIVMERGNAFELKLLVHVHIDVWPGAQIGAHGPKQPLVAGMAFHPDAQTAAQAAGEVGELLFAALELGQDGFGELAQVLSGAGQVNPSPPLFPDLGSKGTLEFFYRVAYRRLGEEEGLRGAGQGAFPDDRADNGEVVTFQHGVRPAKRVIIVCALGIGQIPGIADVSWETYYGTTVCAVSTIPVSGAACYNHRGVVGRVAGDFMCGIVGIVSKETVAQALYDALIVLQHRGQNAAGIATCRDGRFFLRKSNGLVADVFRSKHMHRLLGNMGIAHVRYPTAGTSRSAEAQPLYVNSPYGIVMAHNGNLTNADELIRQSYESDRRHINTRSDSEALLNVFAHEMARERCIRPNPEQIFAAVARTHRRVRGAYAVVAMISGYGLVAFRDPCAIRPLIFGVRENEDAQKEYMVASESVALANQGFRVIRDVAPGEAIVVTANGECHTRQCAEHPRRTPCIFEYVYFARPDSTIDGINVYKARLRMGEKLAESILRDWPAHDIDVVIPIPDTSRSSAIELANRLGVKFREGFIKNRYIGRTFIMPGQTRRRKSVRQKLNPLTLEFRNKNVLLVDDSIVRGTTSEQIIRMAREAGARKVYFASAAPPVCYPNVYGIDMPTHEELIAYRRSGEEVADRIGADKVIYQTLPDLIAAVKETRHCQAQGFDCSVFDGNYVTGDIDEPYLADLLRERGDEAIADKSPVTEKTIGLVNAED